MAFEDVEPVAFRDELVAETTPLSGTTAERPDATTVAVGTAYFDTDLATGAGKPIWSNGTDWVDATGAVS